MRNYVLSRYSSTIFNVANSRTKGGVERARLGGSRLVVEEEVLGHAGDGEGHNLIGWNSQQSLVAYI
jgi:hypothetical protein